MITEPVTYASFDSLRDEGDFIAQQISELIEAGFAPNDIAVIYRTNRQSRAIEDGCIAFGVPYRIIGQTGFWGRFYPKTLVSAFMLAAAGVVDSLTNEDLANAIYACIDTPNRYLGKRTAEYAAKVNPGDPTSGLSGCKLNRRQYASRDMFQEAIYAARKLMTDGELSSVIMQSLADNLGMSQWLKDAAGEDDATPESNGDGQYPILVEVMRAMDEFATPAEFLNYVKGQTTSAAKPEDISKDEGKVTLLTIHRSKGLQWPVVFVPGLVEGTAPHKMAADDKAIQEERRIMYVAFTRAMRHLIVTSPEVTPCDPGISGISRFVYESGLIDYTYEESEND